ncbi:hypothetical protein EUTSA_v10007816mg [Eutrema salsugineum]|uniref:F-box domain-containing protein n=1 Tax=Eutrema salsugineum TaxID=72664 RepID=V4KZ72_EUTSA|nr:F-box protein At5g10340 [Eutrema salsugineum]ESQ36649.1 hypothetical protein EUTSA_v10007816mg [Eutrema salsugineum]
MKRKRTLVQVNIPEDVVVEEILEKLPVKSVLRFRAVSKVWRREIESRRFQERHLKHEQKSREPSIVLVKRRLYDSGEAGLTTLSLGQTSVSLDNHIHYPAVLNPEQLGRFEFVRITRSCDGLVCLYSENYFMLSENTCMYVINPATRWYRQLPEARFQALAPDRDPMIRFSYPLLGFGKDDITGIHKLVWLYNSDCLDLDGQTNTCEVFSLDDTNNTNWNWRHDVIVSCPHPILHGKYPAHVHGSLHWFIDAGTQVQVLSLHLHTETFMVMDKIPVASAPHGCITMCTLNNRLCLSEDKGDTQTIWSFHQDNMAWHKTYVIDLRSTLSACIEEEYRFTTPPLASLLDHRLLIFDSSDSHTTNLVRYNPTSKSFSQFLNATSYCLAGAISYSQSLISLP